VSGGASAANDHSAYEAVFAALPTAYLLMTSGLMIADANRAYCALLGRTREELLGRPVFEAFPPAPGSLDEAGNNPLQLSFERARDTGVPDPLPLLAYDVFDPVSQTLEQRFWSLISAPVRDEHGATTHILQRVEDVTDYVVETRNAEAEHERGQRVQRRAKTVEEDLLSRITELRAALRANESAARRLTGMTEAALQLASVVSVDELVETVVTAGLIALGADDGAVGVHDEGRKILAMTAVATTEHDAHLRHWENTGHTWSPAMSAARTGHPVLLPDMTTGLARSPEMAAVYAATGRQAWAAVPLIVADRVIGSLTLSWNDAHVVDADELRVIEAFAAQCAVTLERLHDRAEERRAAVASREMSETLQRSLLTEPSTPAGDLQIEVRYRPASDRVQVGGDWYDSFVTQDGSTCLVIGDVTGHDRQAAAIMGQIRNLLRGIAYTVNEPPQAVLTAVDRAMRDLHVGALATVILARVEQTDRQREEGVRVLRWANAGHLPPLLIGADGTARLLYGETPDLLLGLDPDTVRQETAHELPPGATVLLYTDGLVERRGASIEDGLDWLVGAATGLAHLPVAELCDQLLTQVTTTAEDDIALLALRAHAQAEAPVNTAGDRTGEATGVRWQFPPVLRSVAAARHHVSERLTAAGMTAEVVDAAAVAVSELVANAVIHARTPLTVRMQVDSGTVRVEVADGSAQLPAAGLLSTHASSGRGLILVAALASSWGVEPLTDGGKAVWFTMDADAGAGDTEMTEDDLLACGTILQTVPS
jgi:serine phosphatase RsbU (regulator of sigma subunit)/anti-sigma regulatory factor (Ser/Thr protein kinase)